MKKTFFLMAALMTVACTLFSCKEDDPTPSGLQETIILRSASVVEGANVDSNLTVITLNYNKVVVVSESANITLNGQKVAAGKNPTTGMSVDVQIFLAANTDYTLEVPSGSVLGKEDMNTTSKAFTLHFSTAPAAAPAGDNEAKAFLRTWGFGWNLGNHFDTYDGGEGSDPEVPCKWGWWDNATPTEQLYENLAAMGVGTVRIPVTWGPYQDAHNDTTYTIKADYMATVKQNVDWAMAHGLKVLLNTHHDEYWQDVTSAASNSILDAKIQDRITKTWTQIANEFKDYGEDLMFETFNELHDASWGWGGRNYNTVYAKMEEWNQLAVDVIRATGSQNATRWIGVPGYCASPTFTCGDKHLLVLPNDPANHIMVAIHTYDPYSFCTEGRIQTWGHNAANETYTDSNNKTQTYYHANDEQSVIKLFEQMKTSFLDKNVPIYMGEFGAVKRKSAANEKFRTYYLEYLCRTSYEYNIPMMLWDNDATSGEVFYYINHNNGTFREEALVRTMIKAMTSTDATYTTKTIYANAPSN